MQKNIESLIAHGSYSRLITAYETSFYSELPLLPMMPTSVLIDHVVTLATLFDAKSQKQVQEHVDRDLSRTEAPINVRAARILMKFAAAADDEAIATEYRNRLRHVLVQYVRHLFAGQRQQNEYSIEIAGHKVLSHAIFSPWDLISWCVECGTAENGKQPNSKWALWQGWKPILQFLTAVMRLEMKYEGTTCTAMLLSRLGSRSDVSRAAHFLFYDRKIEPGKRSLDTNPVYENELKPTQYFAVDNDPGLEVVEFQAEMVSLLYQYLITGSRYIVSSLRSIVTQYLKTFTLEEIANFMYCLEPSVSVALAAELVDNICRTSQLMDLRQMKIREYSAVKSFISDKEKLVMLLEMEPKITWKRQYVAVGDESILKKSIEEELEKKGSHFDNVVKVNMCTLVILQVWMAQCDVDEYEKQKLVEMVETVETFKMSNMKILVRDILGDQLGSQTGADEKVDKVLDKILNLDSVCFVARNLRSRMSS